MADTTQTRGDMLAAISNGLTHLHTRFYGRGPTMAKTHLVDSLIVSMLWDGFTTVERTLIAQGEADSVRAFRRTFQAAMGDQFVEVVEQATGRGVIGYMSAVHVGPDISVELFLLSPEAGPGSDGSPER